MAYTLQSLLSPLVAAQDDWRKRLLSEWPAMVGDLHMRMRLERIMNDTLVIGVYEVHWMQELYMISGMIMQTINHKLGHSYVAKLRFVLVEKPCEPQQKKTGTFKQMEQRPLALPQAECLQRLKDQELRDLLIQLWHRCTV